MVYRVAINATEKIFEYTDSEEKAIAILRTVVEADAKYTFAGVTNWTRLTKNYTRSKQVKWMYVENGVAKTTSKSILLYDTNTKEKYLEAKAQRDADFAKEWKEIQKLFGIIA